MGSSGVTCFANTTLIKTASCIQVLRVQTIDSPIENDSERNCSVDWDEESMYKREMYSKAVPVMLTACIISALCNVLILTCVRWIRRALSPTICFSLSLAAADAYASLVVALGLIVNSLLPQVYGIDMNAYVPCFSLVLEAFRLGGLISSVFHLLALAVNHYLGILRPLHYAATVTRQTVGLTITLMWMIPVLFFAVYFASVSGQGFQSRSCSQITFMLSWGFRFTFSLLFFAPLLLMSVMYIHIYFVVRQHHKGLFEYPSARQLNKNVKAVITTLLILGSYLLGYMPAVLFFVVVCCDCLVYSKSIPVRVVVPVGIAINSMANLKSLVNPAIYAARMPEIREAMRLMLLSESEVVERPYIGSYQNTMLSRTETMTSSLRMMSFKSGFRNATWHTAKDGLRTNNVNSVQCRV